MVLGCPSTWRMNYEAYQTSFSAYKSSTCEPLISTEMDGWDASFKEGREEKTLASFSQGELQALDF
jgi:hypothetical protein